MNSKRKETKNNNQHCERKKSDDQENKTYRQPASPVGGATARASVAKNSFPLNTSEDLAKYFPYFINKRNRVNQYIQNFK